ncbi:NAD(P)/FAD-dependent oxidoreductase [Fulvivirga sp.]|uniref:NAD(P)/FAD-dependent oxidoreductase n=1 Tax=Fulvivirga sp. TaxID=1931237 RepID=UPI0032EDA5DF
MVKQEKFDVIIIGGSYSGLAAGMALGRSLRQVLILDSGQPCNRQTPHSHNFLTQDGKSPMEISTLARQQVNAYSTVRQHDAFVINAQQVRDEFVITTATEIFRAKKLILATGIKDILPAIDGFSECWGITVLHCPYCHGYEIRHQNTGVLGNGDKGYEFVSLISNWTTKLTLFTNGVSTLSAEQQSKLSQKSISIIQTEIEKLEHINGHLQRIHFKDGSSMEIQAIYAPRPFEQHSNLASILGCEITDDGYIKTDLMQKTTVPGIYACGDNVTRNRTVANAVATGTTAGMMLNKEMTVEEF